MRIRKIILTVFIVMSLSVSVQPVNVLTRGKESIVYIIENDQNDFTNEFIIKNETKRFYILVSLTFSVAVSDHIMGYNSS